MKQWTILPRVLSAVTLTLASWQAMYGQVPASRYESIKADHWQKLSRATTNTEHLQIYRETVAQGRYSGGPMLQRMFGNFEPGKFHLRADTPGLDRTVLLLASDSKAQVLGAMRTIR